MATSAREGRRRRLLQDGGNERSSVETGATPEATRARYTPRNGSASFAVATGVAPTSAGALVGVLTVLAAVAAALAWADGLGVALATTGDTTGVARLLMADQPASLAGWWAAALWLAVAAGCGLVYGLRRQRTDDLRGGYRWWLLATVAAAGLSLDAGTGLIASLAGFAQQALGSAAPFGSAGWSPTVWWLVPIAIVVGGIGVRLFVELRESLPAAMASVAAMAAAVFGAALDLGAGQQLASVAPALGWPVAGPVAAIASASFALLSVLFYTRRIVREAAGAVAPPTRSSASQPTVKLAVVENESANKPAERTRTRKAKAAASKRATADAEPATPRVVRPEPGAESQSAMQSESASDAADDSKATWVDGGDGYQDDYEDGPQRRRLSKAERKRLRKQKARRAA